jgi:hypothetical protein
MPDRIPQMGAKHPEPWQQDLNPNATAGWNVGVVSDRPEVDAQTAYDHKEAHELLRDFSDDELKQIPILPTGSRLQQGATYIDLRDPSRHEFSAMGNMEAGPGNWYVPKDSVDYVIWNRLIGVQNPERLQQASE